MPAGDRTGPFGTGQRTGRVAGYCAGFGAPGYMNTGESMYFGRGRCARPFTGRGRGRRPFYCSPAYIPAPDNNQYDRQTEKAFLLSEARSLKEQVSYIEKRLKELEEKENTEEKDDK